jgi:hypothetical protein
MILCPLTCNGSCNVSTQHASDIVRVNQMQGGSGPKSTQYVWFVIFYRRFGETCCLHLQSRQNYVEDDRTIYAQERKWGKTQGRKKKYKKGHQTKKPTENVQDRIMGNRCLYSDWQLVWRMTIRRAETACKLTLRAQLFNFSCRSVLYFCDVSRHVRYAKHTEYFIL